MNFFLNEQRVILIGGTGGIGSSLLKGLLEQGCTVGMSFYNSSILLSESEKKLYQDRLYLQKVDVTDPESIKFGLKCLINKLGRVDAFIYNSGICKDSLLGLMKLSDWHDVMDVNLNGAFLTTRIVSNHMLKSKNGKILFISSSKGVTGSYGQANYSASKAALIGFAKSIARDLGKFNISVNVVCPGFIKTPLNQDVPYKHAAAIERSVLSMTSSTSEVTDFILYMLSSSVFSISGQVFQLDSRL
ncbi:SDR family NAD(P)-dependent oxidoreductase [Bacillus sp. MUM 13]|uniref:SDR family NAD(P)-dependent oxidoreductase n=1 Tax=Bacillus sp. MUM 13 TaxID=1678001 RepID=UPI0008F5F75F|nr:SDR family NAD(P)-dependent oxidoreductase [Bacillus sp. MUM 13]OIK06813.1 hypothetical protein BIV59_21325 [Bacillus sp. MUM 13]